MRTATKGVKSTPKRWIHPVPNTFVLTHHDLAPRNMLVDDPGQLWVLDRELAGWYPKYFEYALMYNFKIPRSWTWLARLRWHLFTWISVWHHIHPRGLQRSRLDLVCAMQRCLPISSAFGFAVGPMDSNWDTDNFDNAHAHLAKRVFTVCICAYINENNEGDEDGNPATNHWVMFLQCGNSSSVRLDMAPGYGSDGRRGKIEIVPMSCIHTSDSIKTLSFNVVGDRTVGDITNLISTKGRQRYKFTSAFEGCRHWMNTVISDLEEEGFVAQGSKVAAWEALCKYWRYPDGSEDREVGIGAF